MSLIDSNVSHDEFVLINNVLKEYDDMKEKIKNLKTHSICRAMLSYYLKCRKNTESKYPKVLKAKNGRKMLLSKCAVCDIKKSEFIKDQEASVLLNSLGIKAPLS